MCSTVGFPFAWNLDEVMRRNRGKSVVKKTSTAAVSARPASVRRALFPEAVDHQDTARVLAREFADLQREARSRWNFDFEKDLPIHGRYEWYPVATTRSGRKIPEQEVQKPSSTTTTQHKKTTVETLKRPVQRKVTDYMSQRKRSSSAVQSSKAPTPAKSRKTASAATTTT